MLILIIKIQFNELTGSKKQKQNAIFIIQEKSITGRKAWEH